MEKGEGPWPVGSVGTGWERAGLEQGEGAPLSPQGSAPQQAQTMGSLCLAPPPLAQRPASPPLPKAAFNLNASNQRVLPRGGGGGAQPQR